MNDIYTAIKPVQVRQGDVLVTPCLSPVDAADLGDLIGHGDGNRVVLAYGEVTGHAHAFYPQQDAEDALASAGMADHKHRDNGFKRNSGGASTVTPVKESPVSLYQLINPDKYSGSTLPAESQRLLRIRERSLLRHEEHTHISLPPGDYVVIQQHEGDEMEELRKVAD